MKTTVAIRIVNKGGFTSPRIIKQGSDQVAFNCPECGKRNKQNMHFALALTDGGTVFNCNGCCKSIEVRKS